MATFNGEKFIAEQIESIINQSYKSWKLIIHDDGSSDKTVSIIKEYTNKYKDKIILIEDGISKGGAKENFFHLLKFTTANYIMFSDQDDFWLKHKILDSFNLIKNLEKTHPQTPLLIHTDLIVTDENLKTISDSMRKFQNLFEVDNLEDASIFNSVTGCTVLFNRLLLDCVSTHKDAIMHDWWIAIECLKNNGKIVYLDKPTILYRQHSRNTVGARKKNHLGKLYKLLTPKKTINQILTLYKQYNLVTNKGFFRFFFKRFIFPLKNKG